MSVVNAIFTNFWAFLMSAILTFLPTAGLSLRTVDTLSDDCRLNVEMISDTHLEDWGIIRPGFIAGGLHNLKHSKAPIDAVLIAGDITNYGDEESVDRFFKLFEKYSPVEKLVFCAGNHDIGHVEDDGRTEIEAREYLIESYNNYAGTDYENIYYSTEINGYKFIVIGDEGYDHWDAITMSEEQLAFLDSELNEGTKDGKPVFVVCHWPCDDINGEQTIWPDSGIDLEDNDVKSIMEKYDNVFYISGHMHAGIKSSVVDEKFGLSNAEQVNGVTYLNLPTYGIVNMFGVPWSCTGAQLEVYDDEVVFRPRNFITNKWYANAEYHFEIV